MHETLTTSQSARRPVALNSVPPQLRELAPLVLHPGIFQNYLIYLHSFGTLNQQDELAPTTLDETSVTEIQKLFSGLDTDKDGLVGANDLLVACEIIGYSYNPIAFRKIDKTRKGNADFPEIVKAFFPQLSLKRVSQIIHRLSKTPPLVLTTRQQIAPDDLAQIDRLYALYANLPGGCTLENVLSQLSSYQRTERADAIAKMFKEYDSDGDGILSLEDYTEMVKFNYPPFKQSNTTPDAEGEGASVPSTTHPLNKDKRVFFPKIKQAVAPTKAFGSSELLAVKAGASQLKAKEQLEARSKHLHVSPTVKHYARREGEDE